jgi:hypothetical protein
MIIYNVTINIDNSVHTEWIKYMTDEHIPEVMDTGYFLEHTFSKILAESEGGTSYSIQYLCSSMKDYDEYQLKCAEKLQNDHISKFGGKFGAFRTILEVVKKGKHDITR